MLIKYIVFILITVEIQLFASLDITDLYLRKIKGVEFTFSGNQGWKNTRRNKFEFFYETDYLMDAGTNNPELITVDNDSDKDPLAISDWGFFIDITSRKNPLDIIFFNFNSKTMMVNPDHPNYYLATIAIAFPEVVAYENSYIRQSILGTSIKYKDYLNISYGIILDERHDIDNYNGFYEVNLPFFNNSFVRNLKDNKIERYEGNFHYDKFNFKLGFRYKNTITSRKHYYISSNIYQADDNYLNMEITLNNNFELASAITSIVFHSVKEEGAKEKFGSAYFFTTSLFLTNPEKNNIWGSQFGDDKLYYGGKLEFSFQAPLLAWAGFFYMTFIGPIVAASEPDDIDKVIKTGSDMIDASSEEDEYFGIFTIGMDYNNNNLLKEIPNAVSHWHFYAKFRIIY